MLSLIVLVSGCSWLKSFASSDESAQHIHMLVCDFYAAEKDNAKVKTFKELVIEAQGYLQTGEVGLSMATMLLQSSGLPIAKKIGDIAAGKDAQTVQAYLNHALMALDPSTCPVDQSWLYGIPTYSSRLTQPLTDEELDAFIFGVSHNTAIRRTGPQ